MTAAERHIRGIKTTLEFPTLKMALSRRFPLTPTRFPPVGFRCQTVNSGRFSWARRSRPLVRNCDRRFSPVILCLRTAPSRSFSSSNGCAPARRLKSRYFHSHCTLQASMSETAGDPVEGLDLSQELEGIIDLDADDEELVAGESKICS